MKWRIVAWALLLAGGFAFAQDDSDADDNKRLTDLENENKDLRERIERLEGNSGGATEGADDALTEDLEEDLDDIASEGLGLNLVIRKGNSSGIFQIYGDVGFVYQDPERSGRGNAYFFNGSVDLFFTARVGDHFQILSETVFQTKVGSEDSGDSSKWDQERLWGAWAFADAFQIKFGLEHSPISLWNRIYHHGRWLELTISRPLLAQFESGTGILPMHEAGIEFVGDIPLAGGSLQYIIFFSNGRADAPNKVQEFSDQNNDKAITFGAGYNFDSSDTIFLGIFARTDEIPPASSTGARSGSIREWIFSIQFLYDSDRFDIISEWVYIDQDDKTAGSSFSSQSGYFQIGYHLSDAWTPYARFDFRNMDQGTPYFEPLDRDLDAYAIVLGARWDFIDNAALKFEVAFGEREERDEGDAVSDQGYIVVGLQLAFVF
ncbi:MAG: outer membrane protein [Planctomycetota bacterium]|jgi:hypothetical protein